MARRIVLTTAFALFALGLGLGLGWSQTGKGSRPSVCADRCIEYDDALRGVKAMSVSVEAGEEGKAFDDASIIKSNVEEVLRKNGITVLPLTNPPTFPVLLVRVQWVPQRVGLQISGYPFVILLEMREVFPVPGMPGKLQRATTWRIYEFGYRGGIALLGLRTRPAEIVSEEFVPAYRKANQME